MSGNSIANDPAAVDARVVKALSHPTRRRILELLQERELASPVELAGDLAIPLGTVSYHVRKLEELGFIELASRTQRRGAIEHHYRASASLDRPRRRRAASTAGDGPAASPESRAAIGTIEEAQAALTRGGFDTPRAGAYGRTLALDADGASQARAAVKHSLARVEQIGRASELRRERSDGGDAGVAVAVAVSALFELDG